MPLRIKKKCLAPIGQRQAEIKTPAPFGAGVGLADSFVRLRYSTQKAGAQPLL
ncbi:hypothetical protein FACS189494_11350 [Spirochaetia bacterium]|nr:hypothetical protein FACS189494_11350 [Spirochaetia bacterium]